MARVFLFFLVLFVSISCFSQRVYFVYLQTEQEQPFSVKLKDKTYASNESGYLILSKLIDSTYNFSVGFPGGLWRDQNFTVPLKAKDHGYLLKNFGDKGWGLFDLQTLSVQMAAPSEIKSGDVVKTDGKKNVSPFTDILSKAADDPSLKEKSVQPVVEEKKQPATVTEPAKISPNTETAVVKQVPENSQQQVAKEDTAGKNTKPVASSEQSVSIKEEIKNEAKKQESPKSQVVQEEPSKKDSSAGGEEVKPEEINAYKRSTITKRSESSTTDGFGLTFIDKNFDGKQDTIRLVIPNAKTVVTVKEEPKEENFFLDVPDTLKTDQTKKEEAITEAKQISSSADAGKNNCKDVAAEADFFKLRKEMAAADGDDDMLGLARKYFKTKCFTVTQIRNLSTLFLTDAGKYKFFDEAYLHVSDVDGFPGLQAELKEDYYINRFKAMLRN